MWSNGSAKRSYAVVWREPAAPVCAGELELGRDRLRLDGALRSGAHATRELLYGEIDAVRIGRGRAERIDGRSSVVVEEAGGRTLLIAGAMGIGAIHEIAEQLEWRVAGEPGASSGTRGEG